MILQKYVFYYFHFFHDHLFQHHSDEKTFLGCSNSPQSLDVAVLFLTTFVESAKGCRGAEWIVNSWLAKMQHINNKKTR